MVGAHTTSGDGEGPRTVSRTMMMSRSMPPAAMAGGRLNTALERRGEYAGEVVWEAEG